MSYATQAAAAKSQARDILRTQMAVRIQERLSKAQATLSKVFRSIADTNMGWSEDDADETKSAAELVTERAAEDAAIAAIPGISADELTALQAEVAAERAEEDAEIASENEKATEHRAEAVIEQTKQIAAARDAVAHAEENLEKLNSGELKVDKDELLKLTQKLIEDGTVPAGSVTSAS